MTTIAVFANDAAHARELLAPLLRQQPGQRWIVVACAPRMTQRIGRYSAHASRQQWRQKWSEKLFAQLRPLFDEAGAAVVDAAVAAAPLPQVLAALRHRHGEVSVFDARLHRLGAPNDPIEAGPPSAAERWALPIAMGSTLSLVLALSD